MTSGWDPTSQVVKDAMLPADARADRTLSRQPPHRWSGTQCLPAYPVVEARYARQRTEYPGVTQSARILEACGPLSWVREKVPWWRRASRPGGARSSATLDPDSSSPPGALRRGAVAVCRLLMGPELRLRARNRGLRHRSTRPLEHGSDGGTRSSGFGSAYSGVGVAGIRCADSRTGAA